MYGWPIRYDTGRDGTGRDETGRDGTVRYITPAVANKSEGLLLANLAFGADFGPSDVDSGASDLDFGASSGLLLLVLLYEPCLLSSRWGPGLRGA